MKVYAGRKPGLLCRGFFIVLKEKLFNRNIAMDITFDVFIEAPGVESGETHMGNYFSVESPGFNASPL